MKFLRTKTTIFEVVEESERVYRVKSKKDPSNIYSKSKSDSDIIRTADTIEELCDEIVLIENGNEHNIVYLQEAYDRIDEYHEQGNYEPRLIGRIKVGLDKKAVAEWKENEQGLYDWVLL